MAMDDDFDLEKELSSAFASAGANDFSAVLGGGGNFDVESILPPDPSTERQTDFDILPVDRTEHEKPENIDNWGAQTLMAKTANLRQDLDLLEIDSQSAPMDDDIGILLEENDRLKAANMKMSKIQKDLIAKIRALENDNLKLAGAYRTLRKEGAQVGQVTALENESLKKQLTKALADHTEAENELTVKMQELIDVQDQLVESNEYVIVLEEELDNNAIRITELEEEMVELIPLRDGLDELQLSAFEATKAKVELEGSVARLEGELRSAKVQIEKLESMGSPPASASTASPAKSPVAALVDQTRQRSVSLMALKKEGFLDKLSPNKTMGRKFQKRYFVFKAGVLSYFKSNDPNKRLKPLGVIDMEVCQVVLFSEEEALKVSSSLPISHASQVRPLMPRKQEQLLPS
eukprot:TRINITY_DN492_c0_g2_i2.p1 TRINITY_DN492_c0_g2~~TRINITY_DN492_c0_g2_i2.p1  ORF type:complete len:406 (-),score=92.22 TRINITY_DN492_c0_g2_i2:192-1409(-)